MSDDEFDPAIERLFARTPQMPDSVLFAADVETKLESGSRVRTLALTLAGLVGGCIAVRESLNINLNLGQAQIQAPAAEKTVSTGLQAAGADVGTAIQGLLNQVGMSDMSLGSMGGMQLFWITAAALVALAAAGVVRLSQDV